MNPAGVASARCDVTTIPVARPFALASSVMLWAGAPSGVTPMRLFLVLYPVAIAVAAAPESVTRLLAE
jgi:hypothetical protein